MEKMENQYEMASAERAIAYAKKLVETWSLNRVHSILEPVLEKTKHETQPVNRYLRFQALMLMGKTLVLRGLLNPAEKASCFRRARSFYKESEGILRHLSDLPVGERTGFDLDHSPGTSILFIDFKLLKKFQTTTSPQNLNQQAGI